VFYQEFGVLMMHQPLIGWDFTTYLPIALVPYILLLASNAFNRVAAAFTRTRSIEFDDDFETGSGAAAKGAQLLLAELENHGAGRPVGLTIVPVGGPLQQAEHDCSLLPT
jgi:hypothetical protein